MRIHAAVAAALASGLALGPAVPLRADTVFLKDGRAITCEAVREEEGYIVVEKKEGGPVLYASGEIARIERAAPAGRPARGEAPARPLPGGEGGPRQTDAPSEGEPHPDSAQAAYLAYLEAFRGGDLEAVRRHLAQAGLDRWEKDFGDLTPEEAMMGAAFLIPANISIDGVSIMNDQAVLSVSGDSPMGMGGRMLGSVTLVREGGRWKYLKEDWSSRQSREVEGVRETESFSISYDPTRPDEEEAGPKKFGDGAEGAEAVSGTVRLFKEPEETGWLRIQFNRKGAGLAYFGTDLQDEDFAGGRADYRIEGVAPGSYTATAWYIVSEPEDALNVHSRTQEVEIRAGRENRVDFVCDQRY